MIKLSELRGVCGGGTGSLWVERIDGVEAIYSGQCERTEKAL